MKIRYKKGRKFDGDRIFSIESNGQEIFTHARLFMLINALAKNEWLIYKKGKWDEKGKPFLYEEAIIDAIQLGIKGITFIDEKDDKELLDFCKRNELMRKFDNYKQTLLNEFIKEDGSP